MANQWEFYLSGREAQAAMLAACERAQSSIDLEQYIFEDDEVGRQFAAVLMERAGAGVKVRLLCDTVGSHTLYVSDLSDQLRAAGIELEFFNPIEAWWLHKLVEWFLRDHRKLLIVDGRLLYLGGVGITAKMLEWRDTHLQVTGAVVAQAELAFERVWQMTRRGKRFFKFAPPPVGTAEIALLTNAPARHQRFIYHAILDAIKNASRSIDITTPYFIPNRKLFRALKRAVRRGVVVKLLVPKEADHVLVHLACASYYWLTLRAGITIYRYEPVMMHAKTIIVDGAWATVGSSNFDNLSMLLNYEDNLVVSDQKFVASLEKHFNADLKNAPQLTQEVWHDRPLIDKLLELLTWPLHRVL